MSVMTGLNIFLATQNLTLRTGPGRRRRCHSFNPTLALSFDREAEPCVQYNCISRKGTGDQNSPF